MSNHRFLKRKVIVPLVISGVLLLTGACLIGIAAGWESE